MNSRGRVWHISGVALFALSLAYCGNNPQQGGTVPRLPTGGKADFIADEMLAPVPDDVFLIRNGDFSGGLDEWNLVPTSVNGTLGGPGLQNLAKFEMDEHGEASDCVHLMVGQKESELTDTLGTFDYGSQQGAMLVQKIRIDVSGSYMLSAMIASTYQVPEPTDRNGYGGLFAIKVRAVGEDVGEDAPEAAMLSSHDFKIINSGETKRHTLRAAVELEAGLHRIELFITRQARGTRTTPSQYVDEILIVPEFEIAVEEEEELPEEIEEIPPEEEEEPPAEEIEEIPPEI